MKGPSGRTSADDDTVRGYSPEVMRRLLQYLKPYKGAAVLTLAALALATVAELLSPIVLRRALDDHILRRSFRLDAAAAERADDSFGAGGPALLDAGRKIEDSLFVSPDVLSEMNAAERKAAEDDGLLMPGDWYVIEISSPAVRDVVAGHPELFIGNAENGTAAAVSYADLRELSPDERRAVRAGDISGLRTRTLQYLLILAFILAFTFAQVYLASWIGQRVMADIRQGLLAHIMRQSLRYLGKTPVGSLVSRTANDVETINEFFTNVAISFLKDGALMIGVIAVIFAMDTRLALVAAFTIVPTFVLIVVFRNRMREAFRKVRSRVSAVNAYLSERIGGMATVHLFDAERRSRDEFGTKSGALLDAEMNEMRVMAVFRPLIDMISSLAIGLVIWYSTGLHDRGLVTLGVLVAFIELMQKFFQPVRDIAEKFNILQSAMAGSERIFAMMDTVDRIPDKGTEGDFCTDPDDEAVCGEIRFEDVRFSYVPGEPVLRGLDFTINPGETVAVVGTTGAGKTTIANLLTRLWDVDGGRILLDGRDIRLRPLEVLRKTVQPVQQDVFLFAGTVTDNIDLGLGVSPEKIAEAARISRAAAFIETLPKGFDTAITEGAANLSAGQRQLIAFARIIAHDPRVIILDEATANVDTETEELLQEGLEALLRERTALIIAHRLSTIRRADRILVLGHGKVIEEGTHAELMRKKGAYHRLYTLQFAEAPQIP